MGLHFLVLLLAFMPFVCVQSGAELKVCPDNKDYSFVVEQLLHGQARRKRQISWSVDCAINTVQERFDEAFLIHGRQDCCEACELEYLHCKFTKIKEYLCKARTLECLCNCRAKHSLLNSNQIEPLRTVAPAARNDVDSSTRFRRNIIGNTPLGLNIPYENQSARVTRSEDSVKGRITCFFKDCSKEPCCLRQYCTKIPDETIIAR